MNFVFYKYDLSRIESRSLFDDDNQPFTLERAQAEIDAMLKAKTLALTSTKKDETVYHDNEIMRSAGGVTLLRVCNERKVKLWEKYRQVERPSNPFLLVVIDNRRGAAQIAVEKGAAFSNTDQVGEILCDCFNRTLAQYGWIMEVRPKKKIGDIWDAVNRRLKTGDTIRRIVIDFHSPRISDTADTNDRQSLVIMQAMVDMMRSVGARSQFNLFAESDRGITLDQTKTDVINIFQACCNNGYGIDITFNDFGLYRVGREVKAIYDIDDDFLTQFENGQLSAMAEGNFNLIARLDEIRTLTKDMKDGKKIDTPRGEQRRAASAR